MHRTLLLSLVAVCAMIAPGCASYSNYPKIESKGLRNDPNSPAIQTALITAVQWVANRYPPGRSPEAVQSADEPVSVKVNYPIAINMPVGTRRSGYIYIAERIGPEVYPLTPEIWSSGNPPVFHITRVWIRMREARIEVLRPMPELGRGPDGNPVYQPVVVRLVGGFSPWRVEHGRAMEPASVPTPMLWYLPEFDRVDEFERAMRATGGDGAVDSDSASDEPIMPEPAPQPAPANSTGLPVGTTVVE